MSMHRLMVLSKAPYAQFVVARGGRRTTDGQEGRQGAERPCLPGRPAWREPGRGATCRAGRGAVPVVSGETDSARRGGCRMAGGPDVARHAAAVACDGKGIRVNGQYRTTVRGPATLTGTGSPSKTQHTHDPLPAAVATAGRGQSLFARLVSMPCRPVRLARIRGTTTPRTRARASAAADDRRRGCGQTSATAPYRRPPTAAGCTTQGFVPPRPDTGEPVAKSGEGRDERVVAWRECPPIE